MEMFSQEFSEEDRQQQYRALTAAVSQMPRRHSWESVSSILGEQTSEYVRELLSTTSGKCVLDLGCGEGTALCELAEQYPQHRYYGIDLFTTAKANPSNVFLMEGDIQKLPFFNNIFDLAYSVASFSYVPDKLQGIREARRVLHRHGRGFINSPRSLVEFVGRDLEDVLRKEKDIEWRADQRLYLQKTHLRTPFRGWNYLCMNRVSGSGGMVKSIFYHK